MPIEIKINNINALSLEQIHDLHEYLTKAYERSMGLHRKSEEVSQPQDASDETPTKPKKRGRPPKTEAAPQITASEEQQHYPWGVSEVDANKPLVTYDTLISYVLEATRTRQLTFEKTTELLNRFNVGCIADLENMPHLIPSVYEAFKELNNE